MCQNETDQSVHNDPSTQSDFSMSGEDDECENESASDTRSETANLSEVDTSTTAQSVEPFDIPINV